MISNPSKIVKEMKDRQNFVCIYCKSKYPEAQPSLSHIIPDFLGGTLELKNAVCSECNGIINKEIEDSIKKDFSYLRFGLNWKTRKRNEIKVPATINISGEEFQKFLNGNF